MSSRSFVIVIRVLFRMLMIGCLLIFLYGMPGHCPDDLSRDRTHQTVIENRDRIIILSSYIEKLYSITKADKIGIFLVDDYIDHLIKVAYSSPKNPDVLASTLYPIYEEQQRDVYRSSYTNGCILLTIEDIKPGAWRDALDMAKTQSGIVCSIKSKEIPSDRLEGIISFEYDTIDAINDPDYILNSIKYYRETISNLILKKPLP